MSNAEHSDGSVEYGGVRYVRAPVPVHFPESAEVPENKRHLELRTLLYLFLKHAFGGSAYIGSEQFVYWDHTNPRLCLAPDAFLRWGGRDEEFGSWYVWERGAPHLAIEILSNSDAPSLERKVRKYAAVGVQELLVFDAEQSPALLRLWDRVDGDLVERKLTASAAASRVLPGYWVIIETEERATLRLSRDAEGQDLYPTPAEASDARAEAERAKAEAETARAEAEKARAETEKARAEQSKTEAEANKARAEASDARAEAALARVRELEAELARRQG